MERDYNLIIKLSVSSFKLPTSSSITFTIQTPGSYAVTSRFEVYGLIFFLSFSQLDWIGNSGLIQTI
jgi:hypothetical protein